MKNIFNKFLGGVFLLIFISFAQPVFSVGNVTVNYNVENVSGGSNNVPKDYGIVKAYYFGGGLGGSATTNSNGLASLYLQSNKRYNFHTFIDHGEYVDNHSNEKFITSDDEYWGRWYNKSIVNSVNLEFERNEPYVDNFKICKQGDSSCSQNSTYEIGDKVKPKIVLDNTNSFNENYVKVRVVLDRNGVSPWDYDETSSVDSNGVADDFDYFTIDDDGQYKRAIVVSRTNIRYTDFSSEFTAPTDKWPLGNVFYVNEPSMSDVDFYVTNVSGGSENVPKNYAFVEAFDDNGNKKDTDETNSSGKANLDLEQDENYNFYTFIDHKEYVEDHGNEIFTVNDNGYWGHVNENINNDDETINFTRSAPYVEQFLVCEGDVCTSSSGGEYEVGQSVKPKIILKNVNNDNYEDVIVYVFFRRSSVSDYAESSSVEYIDGQYVARDFASFNINSTRVGDYKSALAVYQNNIDYGDDTETFVTDKWAYSDFFTVNNIATIPDPEIIKTEFLPQALNEIVAGEEYFKVKVTVKNQGGDAYAGGISYTFPNLNTYNQTKGASSLNTPKAYIEIINEGNSPDQNEIYKTGDTIYNKDAQQISAMYPLIEGIDIGSPSWISDEDHTFVLKIKPKQAFDDFKVYYRTALRGNSIDNWYREPGTGNSILDPLQGFNVLKLPNLNGIKVISSKDDISIPVLMYHKIDTPNSSCDSKYWVTIEMLDKHIKALKAHGYTPIQSIDVYNYKYGNGTLPDKPVLLTFDDGYQNSYTRALPVLKENNTKGTFFISTNYISETNSNRQNNSWDPTEYNAGCVADMMTWNEVRALSDDNLVEIGSHTKSHPDLTTLDEETLNKELADSKTKLEQELGESVKIFSYPFGAGARDFEINNAVRKAGYKVAVDIENIITPDNRAHISGQSILSLERFNVDSDWSTSLHSEDLTGENFFWKQIEQDYNIPRIQIDSVKFYDNSMSVESTTFAPGDTIKM